MKLIKSKTNRLFVHPVGAPYGLGAPYGQYVSIDWERDYQEWRVQPSWALEADYHTTDADDAVGTAHHMIHLKLNAEHRDTAPADCLCAVCIPH